MVHDVVHLLIDSKDYPDQKANDLTVVLDEEFSGVKGVKITQFCVPCTFYNITEEFKNNKFKLYDKAKWKNLVIPDGLYDLRSFVKVFYEQVAEITGSRRRSVLIHVDDTTGKSIIKFEKGYKLRLYEHNVLGFDVVDSLQGKAAEIPKTGENDAISENPANFRPFEYFCVHSNITNSVLVNGNKSDILLKTFVKNCEYGDRKCYEFDNFTMVHSDERFNKLRLWITDEHNKPIYLKNGSVQYELILSIN